MDNSSPPACAGLRAQSQALEVAAHNVANVNTTGFRSQQASFQTLLALARPAAHNPLNRRLTILVCGRQLVSTSVPAASQATGNPLDLGSRVKGFS